MFNCVHKFDLTQVAPLTEQELANALCDVSVAFSTFDYAATRCLAATVVSMRVLKSIGYDCELFPCEATAFSEPMVNYLRVNGYPQNQDDAEALRAAGGKVVQITTETDPQLSEHLSQPEKGNELRGHVCFVAKKGSKAFLIDPTSFQLKREYVEGSYFDNATIQAPEIGCYELSPRVFDAVKDQNRQPRAKANDKAIIQGVTHLECGGMMEYRYFRIKQLDEFVKLHSKGKKKGRLLDAEHYADVFSMLKMK